MRHRYLIARLALKTVLQLLDLTARLLPHGHPARVYTQGQVKQSRPCILKACRPYAFITAKAKRTSRATRLFMAMLTMVATLDSLASSPVNLGLMPEAHILTRLGAPDLSDRLGRHIFDYELP